MQVYQRLAGAWSLTQVLSSPSTTYDGYGATLALSSLTLLVGAPSALQRSIPAAGAVYLYRRPSQLSGYTMEGLLVPPSSYTPSPYDAFGLAVTLVTDDVVAVASRVSGGAGGGGIVFLYTRVVLPGATAATWVLGDMVTSATISFFGSSLAATSSLLVIGAPYFQTNYVPFPAVTSSSAGTAEAYAVVALSDDFSALPLGVTLSARAAFPLSSLWTSVIAGTVRDSGTVGRQCTLSAPALVFASGVGGSQLLSVPLYLPKGARVTVWLQYCDPVPAGATSPEVSIVLLNTFGVSVVQLFTFSVASFSQAPASATVTVRVLPVFSRVSLLSAFTPAPHPLSISPPPPDSCGLRLNTVRHRAVFPRSFLHHHLRVDHKNWI